jgi:hypothetical protein
MCLKSHPLLGQVHFTSVYCCPLIVSKYTTLQCEVDPGDQYLNTLGVIQIRNFLPPGKLPGPKYSQTTQQVPLAEKFHENFELYSLSQFSFIKSGKL